MSTAAERYEAAANHFREAQPHVEGQQTAFTRANDAYQELTKHAGNTLLEGTPSHRKALLSAAERALTDYEKFM